MSTAPPPNDAPTTAATDDIADHSGALKVSTTHFLIALILLLIAMPFLQHIRHRKLIETLLMTAVFISAIVAISTRRRTLVIGLALLIPAMFAIWAQHAHLSWLPEWVPNATGIVFIAFVAGQLVRFVVTARRVNFNVLCAAISGYLTLGVLCALIYTLIYQLDPDAFGFVMARHNPVSGFTAMYFSFSTLSTVGYGDIFPASEAARMVAMCEALTGMFYVTLLVARLVSLFAADQQSVLPNRNSDDF